MILVAVPANDSSLQKGEGSGVSIGNDDTGHHGLWRLIFTGFWRGKLCVITDTYQDRIAGYIRTCSQIKINRN